MTVLARGQRFGQDLAARGRLPARHHALPAHSSDLELINFAAPNDLGSPPSAADGPGRARARAAAGGDTGGARRRAGRARAGWQASAQARKRIKVNGVARRAIDLVGQVNVVLFTPQDVDLVTGPPALRRRYMDVTVSQMDHRYVRLLSQYMKVLAQRNSLLKSLKEQGRNPSSRDVAEEIAYWDDELVKHGSYVVLRREVFADRLSSRAEAIAPPARGHRREQRQGRYPPNAPGAPPHRRAAPQRGLRDSVAPKRAQRSCPTSWPRWRPTATSGLRTRGEYTASTDPTCAAASPTSKRTSKHSQRVQGPTWRTAHAGNKAGRVRAGAPPRRPPLPARRPAAPSVAPTAREASSAPLCWRSSWLKWT